MPSPHIDRFRDALAGWQDRLDANEWAFEQLREDIVAQLAPHQAFGLLDELIPVLLQQTDDFPRAECGALLLALARAAATTEMPPILAERWGQVVAALAVDPQILEEIRLWYRKPAA